MFPLRKSFYQDIINFIILHIFTNTQKTLNENVNIDKLGCC